VWITCGIFIRYHYCSTTIAAKIQLEGDLLVPVERTAEAVDFFLMGAVDQPLVVGLPVVVFVCFLLVLALLVALGTVAFLLACTLAPNASSSSNHPRLESYVPKQTNKKKKKKQQASELQIRANCQR